ncbi:hypothetical protein KM043_000718 [Ampulex compressa]|nr:hypothetical protein KM043_000718 [Ampulex compressa]
MFRPHRTKNDIAYSACEKSEKKMDRCRFVCEWNSIVHRLPLILFLAMYKYDRERGGERLDAICDRVSTGKHFRGDYVGKEEQALPGPLGSKDGDDIF